MICVLLFIDITKICPIVVQIPICLLSCLLLNDLYFMALIGYITPVQQSNYLYLCQETLNCYWYMITFTTGKRLEVSGWYLISFDPSNVNFNDNLDSQIF